MNKKLIGRLIAASLLCGSLLSTGAYAAQVGWVKDGAGRYSYYDNNGTKKTGWVTDNGKVYYIDSNGIMLSDVDKSIDNIQYSFGKNGQLIQSYRLKLNGLQDKTKKVFTEDDKNKDKQWKNNNGNWYFYADGNYTEMGKMKNSWIQFNEHWYYFNQDGVMLKNTTIKDEKGNDCVLNADGALTNRDQPGFLGDITKGYFPTKFTTDSKGNTYCIDIATGGKMVDWGEVNHKWYYFGDDGVMKKNTTITYEGRKYKLGADGALIGKSPYQIRNGL